jgi:thioredoxin 1
MDLCDFINYCRCRLTLPVVKEIRDQFQTQLEVYEINTDDLAEVAENCGVVSIPTILLYHRGSIKDRIIGCVAKNVLAASVAKLLEDFTSDETNSGKQK